MKKLIVAMIAVSLCIAPAIALADFPLLGWKRIYGTYDMTASGSCIHSQNGFVEVDHGWYKEIQAADGTVYAGTTVWIGTWNFALNGTGTYSDKYYATVTPPASDPTVKGGVRIFEDTDVHFTYKITAFGDITITEVDPPNLEYTGTISPDGSTIILVDTPKVKGPGSASPPWWFILCNASRTLIRVIH
jgi:hypothetical protein